MGLASAVYEAHTPPHAPELCAKTVGMKDGKCFGTACYQITFIGTAVSTPTAPLCEPASICMHGSANDFVVLSSQAMCVFGAVLALVLSRRMAAFYTKQQVAHAP